MQSDPMYLLQPVFDWLDGLIRDQGDYLFMLLVATRYWRRLSATFG